MNNKYFVLLIIMFIFVPVSIECMELKEFNNRLMDEYKNFGYSDVVVISEKMNAIKPDDKESNLNIEKFKIIADSYRNLGIYQMAVLNYNKVISIIDKLPGDNLDKKVKILNLIITSLEHISSLDKDFRVNCTKKMLVLNRLEKIYRLRSDPELKKILEAKQKVLKQLEWRNLAQKNLDKMSGSGIEEQIKKEIASHALKILGKLPFNKVKFQLELEKYSDLEKERVVYGVMAKMAPEMRPDQYHRGVKNEYLISLNKKMIELQIIYCGLIEKRKKGHDLGLLVEKSILSQLYTDLLNPQMSRVEDLKIFKVLKMKNINELKTSGKYSHYHPQPLISGVAGRMFDRKEYKTSRFLFIKLLKYYASKTKGILPEVSDDISLLDSIILLAEYFKKINKNGINFYDSSRYYLKALKYLIDSGDDENLLHLMIASELVRTWSFISRLKKPEGYDPFDELIKFESMIQIDKINSPEELVKIGDAVNIGGLYGQRQLKYYKKAEQLYTQQNASWEKIKWLKFKLADHLSAKERLEAFLELKKEAEKSKDKEFLEEIYMKLSRSYDGAERFKYLYAAYMFADIYRKPDDPRISYLLSRLGDISYRGKDYKLALRMYKRQIKTGTGNFWDLTLARKHMCYCFEILKNYKDAELEYKKNVQVCSEHYENKSGKLLVNALFELGKFYYRRNRMEDSEKALNEAYFHYIHSNGKNYFTLWELENMLVKVKLRLKKYDVAEHFSKKLIEYAEKKQSYSDKINKPGFYANFRMAQCKILNGSVDEAMDIMGLLLEKRHQKFYGAYDVMLSGVTFDPVLLKQVLEILNKYDQQTEELKKFKKLCESLLVGKKI